MSTTMVPDQRCPGGDRGIVIGIDVCATPSPRSTQTSMMVNRLMKIRFVTPPISKQVGGIENAVEGLREALMQKGINVMQGGDPTDTGSLHHFHGLWNFSHSRLAFKLRSRGLPYVVSPHGMLEPWAFRHRRWKKLPYFWSIERRFLKGAKSLFFTSEMEAQHAARVISHPCVNVIPLGCRDIKSPDFILARNSLKWPREERVILYLSRVDVKKGLDMLLYAMAASDIQWHGWRLVVVGDGDPTYVNMLKSIVAKASTQLPQVEWIGPIWGNERWVYVQGADMFCLPTHSENFGLAVLESLHVGTPVLTTDQTPWKEFGPRDGLFISRPEVSSIQETLDAVTRRVSSNWSQEDRDGLSAWAGENFAWDKLASLYISAYQGCLR